MTDKDRMMYNLNFEIDKKCNELEQKNRDKILTRLFVMGCIFLLFIPVIFFFTGFYLFVVIIPIVSFFSISTLILSPIIINDLKGGTFNEQAR